jgi:hypothetical protein
MPRVIPKHPDKPRGVPAGAWPAPSGPSIEREVPPKREYPDPREHFIALESFLVGTHYFEKDKWVRRDYPGAAKVAREHPELLVPADGIK